MRLSLRKNFLTQQKKWPTILCATFFLVPHIVFAAMSGGTFEIYADSFSILSDELVTGGNFVLYDSSGEFGAIEAVNGTIELRGGFQAMEKGFLTVSLSDQAIDFGQLSTTTVASDTIVLHVSTDSETGYSVSMSEDGNLRTALADIDDVLDGVVTAGSEEYGVSFSGSDTSIVGDVAIVNGLLIASATGTISAHETDMTFKAAISPGTQEGNYSHTVTLTATVNP